jgi:flagellar biosynthesis/type III secretory pathway protein FliH
MRKLIEWLHGKWLAIRPVSQREMEQQLLAARAMAQQHGYQVGFIQGRAQGQLEGQQAAIAQFERELAAIGADELTTVDDARLAVARIPRVVH